LKTEAYQMLSRSGQGLASIVVTQAHAVEGTEDVHLNPFVCGRDNSVAVVILDNATLADMSARTPERETVLVCDI
jgi:hypothetical protein